MQPRSPAFSAEPPRKHRCVGRPRRGRRGPAHIAPHITVRLHGARARRAALCAGWAAQRAMRAGATALAPWPDTHLSFIHACVNKADSAVLPCVRGGYLCRAPAQAPGPCTDNPARFFWAAWFWGPKTTQPGQHSAHWPPCFFFKNRGPNGVPPPPWGWSGPPLCVQGHGAGAVA